MQYFIKNQLKAERIEFLAIWGRQNKLETCNWHIHSYKVVTANIADNCQFTDCRHREKLPYIWSHFYGDLANGISIQCKILLLALFWSPPTPEEHICLFTCQILHFLHQLVVKCVYLPFGAVQVVNSGFIKAFFPENSCLQQMEARLTRAVRLNQNL